MIKQIKKVSVSDLDKFCIIFDDYEVVKYGLNLNDKIDMSDMFLIEGVKP